MGSEHVLLAGPSISSPPNSPTSIAQGAYPRSSLPRRRFRALSLHFLNQDLLLKSTNTRNKPDSKLTVFFFLFQDLHLPVSWYTSILSFSLWFPQFNQIWCIFFVFLTCIRFFSCSSSWITCYDLDLTRLWYIFAFVSLLIIIYKTLEMCRSFCVLSNLKSLTLWDYFSFPYWISLFLLFCTLEDNRFSGGGLFFFVLEMYMIYGIWGLLINYQTTIRKVLC